VLGAVGAFLASAAFLADRAAPLFLPP